MTYYISHIILKLVLVRRKRKRKLIWEEKEEKGNIREKGRES